MFGISTLFTRRSANMYPSNKKHSSNAVSWGCQKPGSYLRWRCEKTFDILRSDCITETLFYDVDLIEFYPGKKGVG